MMSIGGKRIIPAPFASFGLEFSTMEDGTPIGSTFVITLKGTLVARMGSPNSSGQFHTGSGYPADEVIDTENSMGALLRKQEALQALFSIPGQVFEIQTDSGAIPPVKCNPRLRRIEFPEGGQGRVSWVDKCDYIITLEADTMVVGGNTIGGSDAADYKVSKANEEWAIELLDEKNKTYRLTHSASATGKRFYKDDGSLEMEAWEQAKKFVVQRIGLGLVPARMAAPDVLNANSLQAFNYVRTQHINESAGVFQVTESWVCFDPQGESPAIDEYSVQVRKSAEGRTSVSVEGTLTGLEERNGSFVVSRTRWENAASKWSQVEPTLIDRALTLSNVTLNATPIGKQINMNKSGGVITYHYEYDDRPNPTVPDAISEDVTVVNHNQADIYAAIPVLGRDAGPVLQAIGTKSKRQRSITIEIVMPSKTQSLSPMQPNTTSLVLSYKPSGSQVFVDQDEESWNANRGRYTRSTAFSWEP